jgi:hypothetical protein
MGTINMKYDLPKDLTLVKAKGGMTSNDFTSWAANYISNGATGLILWDLLGADMTKLSSDEIRRIVTSSKGFVPKGAKAAFVFKRPCDFGVGRMLEAYSEVEELPSKFRAFRSLADAKEWLGI